MASRTQGTEKEYLIETRTYRANLNVCFCFVLASAFYLSDLMELPTAPQGSRKQAIGIPHARASVEPRRTGNIRTHIPDKAAASRVI